MRDLRWRGAPFAEETKDNHGVRWHLQRRVTGENPATADAIYAKLPIEGKANVWGEEIYFSIPVTIDLESAKPLVDVGDIAYWPPGRAISFFFGPTPASWDKEIRATSSVNVFASIENNAKLFKLIPSGEKIRIEKDEP